MTSRLSIWTKLDKGYSLSDFPPEHGNISELDECDADMDGVSSSDTASTCSDDYSSG